MEIFFKIERARIETIIIRSGLLFIVFVTTVVRAVKDLGSLNDKKKKIEKTSVDFFNSYHRRIVLRQNVAIFFPSLFSKARATFC